MYKTLLTAASTGLQNQAMFSALSNSADQSFRLGSWDKNVSISDSETMSVGINLEFDILVEASFPVEWDEEASEFAFIQHAELKVGGEQQFYFATEWFTFDLYIDTYALTADLIKNTFFLETSEWNSCDHMTRGYEIAWVNADVDIGFKKCVSSIYDIAFEDGAENYSCAIEVEELETIYRKTFGNYFDEKFGYDSCDRDVEFEEPEEIMSEHLDDTWIDENDNGEVEADPFQ